MPWSLLKQLVEEYENNLNALIHKKKNITIAQILEVFYIRDRIKVEFEELISKTNSEKYANEINLCLKQLSYLDNKLFQNGGKIIKVIDLPKLRTSRLADEKSWWWYLESHNEPPITPIHQLVMLIRVLLLLASFSLVVDISSRLITAAAGPDILGAFIIVVQGLLVTIGAIGLFSNTIQKGLEHIFVLCKIPPVKWMKFHLIFTLILVVPIAVLWFELPNIAKYYNYRGIENYNQGNLTNARQDYERAIKINPLYIQPHYNLGSLYEDLGNNEKAQEEYVLAVEGKLPEAYNNLGRLLIKDDKFSEAIPYLRLALNELKEPIDKYNVLKNLGWAWIGQKRFSEAETYLSEAIKLDDNKAPAHCLIAQVYENSSRQKEALYEWERCLSLASEYKQDEIEWLAVARQRLEK